MGEEGLGDVGRTVLCPEAASDPDRKQKAESLTSKPITSQTSLTEEEDQYLIQTASIGNTHGTLSACLRAVCTFKITQSMEMDAGSLGAAFHSAPTISPPLGLGTQGAPVNMPARKDNGPTPSAASQRRSPQPSP